ncbi:MAG TPA: NADH-quinone oxidoreductase subunit C [bacterium]|nr:NADH-quinone oxidoreductase subunit C [bacterium]
MPEESTFIRPQDAHPDPEAWAKGQVRELVAVIIGRYPSAELEPEGTVYRKPSIRVRGIAEARGVFELVRHNEILPMNYCRDVTVIDWLAHFEVVYVLTNMPMGGDLVLRVDLTGQERDGAHMPSMTDLWPGCNFMEREAWDMYGVVFDGHPNLRRLLLQDEWIGHPLRKDYPWKGRVEDLDAIDAVLPRGWREMLLAEEEAARRKALPKEAQAAAPAAAPAAPTPAGAAEKPAGPVKDLNMAERIRLAKALSEQKRKEKQQGGG